MNYIDKLLKEWSYRVSDGKPNPKNESHLWKLKEILREWEWNSDAINELVGTLQEDTLVKNLDTGNKYLVKNVNKKKHQVLKKNATKDDLEKEKSKKDSDDELSIKLSKSSRENVLNRLKTKSQELIDSDDREERRNRSKDAVSLVTNFFETDNVNEQRKILKKLIENKYITTNTSNPNQSRRKIYFRSVNLSPQIRKLFAESTASNYMWDVARKNGLQLEMDDSSQGRREAAFTGQFHEAGTASELANMLEIENKSEPPTTGELEIRLDESGGDVSSMKRINKKSAEILKDNLIKKYGDDANITSVRVVGTELAKSGQSTKDPTDLIVKVERGGKIYYERISMKAYKSLKSINMKNAGMRSVGEQMFGSDKLNKRLLNLSDNDGKGWNFSDKDEREEYQRRSQEILYEELEEMVKSKDGQENLKEMWRTVHGCNLKDSDGNSIGVSTLIANKTTEEVVYHESEYYCSPPEPIKVVKKNKSITIEVGDKDGIPVLELVTKTEKKHKDSGVLIFNHKE